MSDQEKNLADIQDMQIEPLSDSDLDSVAGGAMGITDTCSGCTSHSYCTNISPPVVTPGPVTPGGMA